MNNGQAVCVEQSHLLTPIQTELKTAGANYVKMPVILLGGLVFALALLLIVRWFRLKKLD